ncbi:ABC transporter permease [Marinoscillum sp.]|uniref:ABC transporter permease n=1 Tax=Marinoscillum sp. TaxID=2024838 RepID=UPI003BA8B4E0
MLKNYFKTIIRQIRKEREFSIINVIGLAVGMAACLVIAQFVYFHSTFDQYHERADDIYRLTADAYRNGEGLGEAIQVSGILAKTAAEQDPTVDNYARFWSLNYMNASVILQDEEKKSMADIEHIYCTDQSTFAVFDLPFMAGSAERFDEPQTAIMTESTARQYFDDFQSAIGRPFTLAGNNGSQEFELVGIIRDLPDQTHLRFNLLLSMESMDNFSESRIAWASTNFYAYLLVNDQFNEKQFLQRTQSLHETNGAEKLKEYGYIFNHRLQKLTDIHLHSENYGDFSRPMNFKIINALAIIGITILVIAWINYLNLGLVRTIERLKEVGIRKSLGSSTRQITALFLMEATVLNLAAFLLALTIVQLLAPYIGDLTGVTFNIFDNPEVTLTLVAIVMIGTLLIGLYPSAVSNRLSISGILVGQGHQKKVGGMTFRKILVGLQFTITFLLVSGTLVVERQIRYMKTADLGIAINDVMVIQAPPGDINSNDRQDMVSFNAFKTELKKHAGIDMVVNAGEIPGERISWNASIKVQGQTDAIATQASLVSMGLGFTDFLGLKVVAGRGLQKGDDPWSRGDVVINERMAQSLGFENPEDAVGAKLTGFYAPLEVRGVLQNHHHNSLHYDYDPIIYILSSWTEYYFIKLNLDQTASSDKRYAQMQGLVQTVESEWNQFFDFNMDYFFLDSYFNRQYNDDERFGNIFSAFSGLAIFIACLGLFGLTSFTIKQKTKEIGIRKVLGATMADLIILLSKNYIWIMGASYLLAMPVVWYVLNKWLENYSFRIELGLWLLLVPLVVVSFIAGMTILSKMLKASKMNPVKSLRYE